MVHTIISIQGFPVIEINVTPDMIKKAETLYPFDVLANSVKKGKGNIYGAIGELVVQQYFNMEYQGTYNHDLISNKGKTVEVKTRSCNSKPKKFYNVGIFAYNTKQKCDYYIFTRVLKNKKKAWILGYMGKQEFLKKSVLKKQGTFDEKAKDGWAFNADTYNLEIKDLYKCCEIN